MSVCGGPKASKVRPVTQHKQPADACSGPIHPPNAKPMTKSFALRIAAMNAMYKLPARETPALPEDVVGRLTKFKATLIDKLAAHNCPDSTRRDARFDVERIYAGYFSLQPTKDVCFEVGCSSLGTFSSKFTELVGVPPSVYRREAEQSTAGMPSCVSKQVTRPIRNREAQTAQPQLT